MSSPPEDFPRVAAEMAVLRRYDATYIEELRLNSIGAVPGPQQVNPSACSKTPARTAVSPMRAPPPGFTTIQTGFGLWTGVLRDSRPLVPGPATWSRDLVDRLRQTAARAETSVGPRGNAISQKKEKTTTHNLLATRNRRLPLPAPTLMTKKHPPPLNLAPLYARHPSASANPREAGLPRACLGRVQAVDAPVPSLVRRGLRGRRASRDHPPGHPVVVRDA